MPENDAKVNGESTDSSNGNLDAERAVIGSCLLDNDVVEDCLSVLPASGYFTLPAHQELWDAITQ
jgi:replicative DNA helicase